MSFINVPFSLIEKRWFTDEMAVRAWVFLAARGILSKSNPTVSVKNKIFELQPGETLCTRSYLSKSLKITDSNAKGVTDKLGRSKSIFKQIELLDKGFRNKITRIKVEGIPVPNDPNEAFLKVAMADDIAIMWQVKYLAQLYIYLMVSANKFDRVTIAGRQILETKRGELVISYKEMREKLKISEYYLKKTIHFLEGLALVSAEIAIVTFAHGSIAIIPIHIEKFEVSVNLIPIWCGSYHTRLSSHYKIVAVYLKFDHVHIVKAVRYFGVIKSCYFHGITSLFVIILYHNEGRTWTFQAEYH